MFWIGFIVGGITAAIVVLGVIYMLFGWMTEHGRSRF